MTPIETRASGSGTLSLFNHHITFPTFLEHRPSLQTVYLAKPHTNHGAFGKTGTNSLIREGIAFFDVWVFAGNDTPDEKECKLFGRWLHQERGMGETKELSLYHYCYCLLLFDERPVTG